ncbi:methylated-DNA--[protein]-cysteine S-methyltransferase [Haloarchaeobius sp. TZWWS8]|uniref:methylated-DNA--[protein]-cysteine S-methyltransferase n=1 Tax=Haloarchaeobius sp. TZWWS8 TaxID=3446121 RepID=UPI003EC0E2BD
MEDAGIYARHYPFLERYVQLGIASGRVISVSFPQHPDDDASEDHELLDRIQTYLDGVQEVDFSDVQVGLTVPTDQRAVLETLRERVPYGEQVDVKQLARMTPGLDPQDEDDLILVRTALDANPTPLFIPDHRVRDGPSAAPPEVEQRLRSVEEL